VHPRRRVAHLVFPLRRIRGPERVIRHARREPVIAGAAVNRQLHRRPCRVVQVRIGEAAEGLLALIVLLAPVLETQFVRERGRKQAVQLRHAVIQLHKICTKHVDRIVVRGLRLHAARRIPPQPVVQEAHMLLVVNLPVDLWRVQHLVARARRGAQIVQQARSAQPRDRRNRLTEQQLIVMGRCHRVVSAVNAVRQRTGVGVTRRSRARKGSFGRACRARGPAWQRQVGILIEERARCRRLGDSREVTPVLIVRIEPKQLVPHQRTTCAKSPALAPVHRPERHARNDESRT
jgi:hypothetical protein